MARRQVDQDTIDRAQQLLDDGKSEREAARTVGISADTLRRRLKKKPDPAPKPPRRETPPAGGGKGSPTDDQLISRLSKVATLPAIPAGLFLHCEFCADHFTEQGPRAARLLVEQSRTHPQLRWWLEAIWKYAEDAAWAALLASFVGVPIAHHMAPGWLYPWIQKPMGLPPRALFPEHDHHRAGAPAGEGPPPGSAPDLGPLSPLLANMDTDQVVAQARAMGIELDPESVAAMIAGANGAPVSADTPEPAPEAEANGAESAAAAGEAEALESDPDAGLGAA